MWWCVWWPSQNKLVISVWKKKKNQTTGVLMLDKQPCCRRPSERRLHAAEGGMLNRWQHSPGPSLRHASRGSVYCRKSHGRWYPRKWISCTSPCPCRADGGGRTDKETQEGTTTMTMNSHGGRRSKGRCCGVWMVLLYLFVLLCWFILALAKFNYNYLHSLPH